MFHPTSNLGLPAPDEPEQGERRMHLRRRCSRAALVRVEGTAVEAQVRNISFHGIGLLLSRRLPPGTLLTVEMKGHKHPLAIEARVVHCTQQPRGWLTGCQFIDGIDEEELEEWLS